MYTFRHVPVVAALVVALASLNCVSVSAEPARHAPPICKKLVDCADDSTLSAPSMAAPPGSGVTQSNATYTVPEYLEWVVKDADTEWTNWFKNIKLTEPDLLYRIIGPSDGSFTSSCTDAKGKKLVVNASYPNAFYCSRDSDIASDGKRYTGTIILPVLTFQKMWDGNIFSNQSAKAGDFAAGIIVAHEFGHHVQDELAIQLKLSSTSLPIGKNKELIADCFAGNWAASLYQRNSLEDGDIEEAIEALNVIGDPTVSANGHGTAAERVLALRVGLIGRTGEVVGSPMECLEAYWPRIVSR